MTDTNPNLPPSGKPASEWTKAEQDAFWHEQNEKAKRVHDIAISGLTGWVELRDLMTVRQWYAIENFVRAAVEQADYFGKGSRVVVSIERMKAGRKHSPNDRWHVEVEVTPTHRGEKAHLFTAHAWAHIGKRAAVDGSLWDFSSNKYFGSLAKKYGRYGEKKLRGPRAKKEAK